MADKPIDWLDIGLHSLPAALWAGMAGWMAAVGAASDLPSGVLLLIVSVTAWAGGVLFWAVRELEQHGGRFGGRQSWLEWIIPGAIQLVTGPALFLLMT